MGGMRGGRPQGGTIASRCDRQNGGYARAHAPRKDVLTPPLTHNTRPNASPGGPRFPPRPIRHAPAASPFARGTRVRGGFRRKTASGRLPRLPRRPPVPHSPRSRRHRGKGSRETPSDGAVRGRFSVGNRHGPRPRPLLLGTGAAVPAHARFRQSNRAGACGNACQKRA